MKKLLTMTVAVLLVSGAAFAGGKKCADKANCKKESKTVQKDAKATKATSATPAKSTAAAQKQ